ncbi:MAG: integration host factor subunit alpha [Legionellales bacterium RIFCSPHIGHO2_12_FULL_37_14]|nr:MAG: integration host factor subunit alpha [Legionellales bacterium RIFCSPHIGHO2_12_FULL_37_14]
MKTLTKAEIVSALYYELGINRKDSAQLVDAFFATIIAAFVNNEAVKLSGFGNFTVRNKKERPGRNPKTGEFSLVSARRSVSFKASNKLKNDIA